MNHVADQDEMEAMGSIDFIVPLKQVGLISRSVLEAIREFYQPRRIIVVTRKAEGIILNKLSPYWNCGPVECVDEETFFVPNFNLSLDDIVAQYDPCRPGDQREPGWWIQQLIKLGAATQIPNISPTYVVWDGDLVPTRRWRLCSKDASGNLRYHIAILQGESRSEFNTTQYANCMRALVGYTPLEPVEGGTYVAHHMVFQARYVREMLELMAEKTASLEPWPMMIMSSSRKFYRFSEYKTYATFMLKNHPEDFNYHELSLFGDGGLRFREANNIIDDMLRVCRIVDGGIKYSEIAEFVGNNWKHLTTPGQCMPAYIQLDHVYGLEGIDLNMSSGPPTHLPSSSSVAVVTPPTAPGSDCDDESAASPSASDFKRLTASLTASVACASSAKVSSSSSSDSVDSGAGSDSESEASSDTQSSASGSGGGSDCASSILPAKRPWVCVN